MVRVSYQYVVSVCMFVSVSGIRVRLTKMWIVCLQQDVTLERCIMS